MKAKIPDGTTTLPKNKPWNHYMKRRKLYPWISPKEELFHFPHQHSFQLWHKNPSGRQPGLVHLGWRKMNNDITSKLGFMLASSGYHWFHFDSSCLDYQDQKPSWISQKPVNNDMVKASKYIKPLIIYHWIFCWISIKL